MDPLHNPTNDNPLFQNLTPKKKVVQPLPGQTGRDEPNPAADMIRQKISTLYEEEPDAKQELAEAEEAGKHRSKHQQYMHELSQSGKSLAEIQTAWHEYYAKLSDHEKHEVWQEFYAENTKDSPKPAPEPAKPHHKKPEHAAVKHPVHMPEQHPAKVHVTEDNRSVGEIKQQLVGRVRTRSQIKRSAHIQSLLFGLSMGFVVVAILLFSFFNERIIAPFITPSRSVSDTPIITDPNNTAVGPEAKLIIPKINVEIPVVYDEPSIAEDAVQRALERGVLHYATTPNPGETGNGVIFGHSSNNILNKGKYKFAFVLLHRMEPGDTFMVQKNGVRYTYRIFDKKVVSPRNVSVLGATSKPATFTLITCDPPGTSLNRLVVTGEQISPDPAANIASKVPQNTASTQPQSLPSDAPSLWSRFTSWISG